MHPALLDLQVIEGLYLLLPFILQEVGVVFKVPPHLVKLLKDGALISLQFFHFRYHLFVPLAQLILQLSVLVPHAIHQGVLLHAHLF